MCSLDVWAGVILIDKARSLCDIHDPNVTLRSELERYGYLGDIPCDVVNGFQLGKDAHTGTTPSSARHDPLRATSRRIAVSNDIAKRHDALASTGIIKIPSNASTNTIASDVTFTLDIRHLYDEVVHAVQDERLQAFAKITAQDGKGVTFYWTLDTNSPAVKFDSGCIASIKAAADNPVGPERSMLMTSGAGHDSVYANQHCPTAMIFVPCKD
ncbi:amidase [Penicillium malachiteum]|nr:amidase [Penicillium malachiteum]